MRRRPRRRRPLCPSRDQRPALAWVVEGGRRSNRPSTVLRRAQETGQAGGRRRKTGARSKRRKPSRVQRRCVRAAMHRVDRVRVSPSSLPAFPVRLGRQCHPRERAGTPQFRPPPRADLRLALRDCSRRLPHLVGVVLFRATRGARSVSRSGWRRNMAARARRTALHANERAQAVRCSATPARRSRICSASAPRSSRRGSAASDSSPNTRSNSGVVR